jgi:transposase
VCLSGIGALTASALAATVIDAQQFRCGRQFAAWLGLTPRQYSTGGRPRLGRITRRGDAYLRTLLVQGARSALQAALLTAPERRTRLAAWIAATYARIGYHKTLVAIANKHARLVWVLLTHDEPLRAHAATH